MGKMYLLPPSLLRFSSPLSLFGGFWRLPLLSPPHSVKHALRLSLRLPPAETTPINLILGETPVPAVHVQVDEVLPPRPPPPRPPPPPLTRWTAFLFILGLFTPYTASAFLTAPPYECGNGVAGIVLPEQEEKVIAIKKSDAIAIPFGVVTWWYNKQDTEFVVLFLGDTSKAHESGSFTDFFLAGSNSIFRGFSNEFVGRAWDLPEDVVRNLVGKQTGQGIVKLAAGVKMPEPNPAHYKGMALNCEEAPLDVDIKNGGRVVVLNTKNLPLVGEVGLGADLVRLDGSAMCSPGFSCDSALQVTFIVRGSGRVQVVGVDGKRKLEITIKAGHLFIVPRFFVVSKIADPCGLEWFSIISTPNPIFTHLAGSIGTWKSLSPEVIQASFNVGSDVENLFRSKRANEAIFFPPPN